MRVISLHIERRPNYDADYPDQLVGMVQLQGETGKIEVKLSNSSLVQIFSTITQDVERGARSTAAQVGHAISEIQHEIPLLTADEIKVNTEALALGPPVEPY